VTIQPSTIADRLDRAVDLVMTGAGPAAAVARAGLDSSERSLLETAQRARGALLPPPIGTRFEARLGTRLAGVAQRANAFDWAVRHPRLVVTGAVGSAAVGVGVTAYAVWRSSRGSHRFGHR
jgi:hypothetical protein